MRTIRKGQIALIETPNLRKVKTLVYEIQNDRIVLSFDKADVDTLSSVKESDELKVAIYTPVGIRIAKSMVINPPENGLLVIEFNNECEIIQRRQYVRAHCKLKILIKVDDTYINAYTRDLGGGGVRFESEYDFKVGQIIDVRIVLQNYTRDVKAKGVIIKRVEEAFNVYIIRFTQIDESDRDRIIKHCLKLHTKEYTDGR